MPLTPPSYRHDALPVAQTPTPSSSFQYNGPLTSIKPFNAGGIQAASKRKPHPLAQVSMMNSTETDNEDDMDLGLSRTLDLGLNKKNSGRAMISLEGSDEDGDGLTLDERLAALDDNEGPTELEYDSALSDDDRDQSLRIGLSSLPEPGIARSGVAFGARLSDAPEQDLDASFPANANDFSRDLSAFDIPISPERPFRDRPGAPTPNHASRREVDENFNNVSSTPASGFDGMARQLRKDFERLTGLPSPSRSNAERQRRKAELHTAPSRTRQESNGTLRGLDIPSSDDRAKRVFGTELGNGGNGVNPVNLRGGPSRPAAKPKKPIAAGLAQALRRNAPAATTGKARTVPEPKIKAPQVVIDEDSEPTPRPPHRHFQQQPPTNAPLTPELPRRSARDSLFPPSARRVISGDVSTIGVPDVTGLTEGLRSPDKARIENRRSRSGRVSSEPDPALTEALHQLKTRLDGLELENESSGNKVKQLQTCLRREKDEHDHVRAEAGRVQEEVDQDHRSLRSLRGDIARLSTLLSSHSHALSSLKDFQDAAEELFDDVGTLKGDVNSWKDQVDVLRGGLEQVADEVAEVRGLVEGLLQAQNSAAAAPAPRRQARVQADIETDVDEGSTAKARPRQAPRNNLPNVHRRLHAGSQQQQRTVSGNSRASRLYGVHEWQKGLPTVSEASEKSARSFIEPEEIERLRTEIADEEARRSSGVQGPSRLPSRPRSNPETFRPSLNGAKGRRTVSDDLKRAETILRSLPKSGHDALRCSECRKKKKHAEAVAQLGLGQDVHGIIRGAGESGSRTVSDEKKAERREKRKEEQRQAVPPQTVLARVLSELEEDFGHHRAIFIELSDEYRKMDPASSHVGKRRALAEHLKESVDVLEQKAEHIKRLYDLLHFRDVPALPGGDPAWDAARAAGVCI